MKIFVNDSSPDCSVHQGRLYFQPFSVSSDQDFSSKQFDQAQQYLSTTPVQFTVVFEYLSLSGAIPFGCPLTVT